MDISLLFKIAAIGILVAVLYTSGINKPSGVTDVFMSDYQTIANVTITSLANAYNTIPDLRATQMELGLSVDLEWKTGISFDVTID